MYLATSGIPSALTEAFTIAVVLFTNDAWYDLARLDGDRLIDHALLIRVVTHLDIAGHGEVLAKRVPYEPVIGKDATKIRVAFKYDAVQVECFALVPVGGGPDSDYRIDYRQFIVRRV